MALARTLGQVLLVVGVLQGAGWVVLRAAGVRAGWAWAAATPTAWGLVGVAATMQPESGIPTFSLVHLAVSGAVLTIVLGAVRRALRRPMLTPDHALVQVMPRSRRGPQPGLTLVSMAVSIVAAFLAMAWATQGDFTVASQTWDAPFHINTIRHVAESGVANPNTIASLVSPDAPYYPAGFSCIGAFVMFLTGCGAVEASNIAAVALAGSLWPTAVMTGVAFGLRWQPVWVAVAGAVAVTNWGMPWSPLGWGVLWPTAAGAAYAPVVLGAMLAARRREAVSRWLPVGLGGVVAAFAMHPRTLVLIGAQCLALALWWLVEGMARRWRTGDPQRVRHLVVHLAGLIALLVIIVAGILVVGRGAKFAAINWSTDETFVTAVAGHLVGASGGALTTGLTAVLGLIGLFCAWRYPPLRWLAALWTGFVIVDAATAGMRARWLSGLTRLWYNDRYRSVTMLAFAGVVLAVVGLRVVVRQAPGSPSARAPRLRWIGALTALVVLASLPSSASYLHARYAGAAELPGRALVSADQRAFYARMAEVVPPDDWVLNNAADGSSLLFAYEGLHPVFQAIGANGATPHGDELQRTLVTSTDHGRLCQLLTQDDIRWVLSPHVSMDRLSVAPIPSPGIDIPDGFWLTTLVLSDPSGRMRLYRITGCPP